MRECGTVVCTCQLPKDMCACGLQTEGKCECGFTAKETATHFKCGWQTKLVIRASDNCLYEMYESDKNSLCHPKNCKQT